MFLIPYKPQGAAAAAPISWRFRLCGWAGLVIVLALGLGQPVWAGSNKEISWADDEDMTALYEALITIQEQHLFAPDGPALVDKSLKGLLRGLDPYSDYLNPTQYRAFKKAGTANYAGLGMDINQDAQGRITCLPWPGEPAFKAGVRPGDELLAVDGRATRGRSVFVIGSWIRGRKGQAVVLSLKSGSGRPKKLKVIRKPLSAKTIDLKNESGLTIIRISRFSNHTATDLAKVLGKLVPGRTLVFDLRGNPGGDFEAAVEAADYLLPPGQVIVGRRTRAGLKRLLSQRRPLDSKSRIFIWQDGSTASAAEVFIAALTGNNRAESLGRTSYGKGLSQKIVPLSTGAALVLTQARLISPTGRAWQGRGLEPSLPLKGPMSRQALLAATRSLL